MHKYNKLFVVIAILAIFLGIFVACNKDPNDAKPSFSVSVSIDNETAATVDYNNCFISYLVSSSTESFDLNNIKYDTKYFKAKFYLDANYSKEFTGSLPLSFGENNIYIIFTDLSSKKDSKWQFKIFKDIEANSIKSLSILEWKTVYLKDSEFEEGKLTVTYTDNTTNIIQLTKDMVTGFSTSATGKFTVTIKYFDTTITQDINVIVRSVQSIVVKNAKQNYFLGEDFVNGTLTRIYNDNSKDEVEFKLENVTGFDTKSVGEKTITITYAGFATSYKINVVAPTISSIKVKQLKQNYYVGDTFEEGVLVASYNDGSIKEVPLTKTMVKGFETTKSGDKTLTISYSNLSINYTISVVDIKPSSISVKSLKKDYFVGDTFQNGTLTVTYNNGTTKEISITEQMVKNFNTQTAGEKTLTIEYLDASTTYAITVAQILVSSIAIKEFNKNYNVGQQFQNGTLTVTYNNKTTKDITITKDMVTGFTTASAGEFDITITYNNKTVSTTIIVNGDNVTALNLGNDFVLKYDTNSTKLIGSIVATLDDGSTKDINIDNCTVTPQIDFKKFGNYDITITYGGISTCTSIFVNNIAVLPDYVKPSKNNICTYDNAQDIVINSQLAIYFDKYPNNKDQIKTDYINLVQNKVQFQQFVTNVQNSINSCGFTQEGFDAIFNDLIPLINYYIVLGNKTVLTDIGSFEDAFFNLENIERSFKSLQKVATLVTPEQAYEVLSMLIESIYNVHTVPWFENIYDPCDYNSINNQDFKEFLGKLQNTKYIDILSNVGNKEQITYLIKQIFTFVDQFTIYFDNDFTGLNKLPSAITDIMSYASHGSHNLYPFEAAYFANSIITKYGDLLMRVAKGVSGAFTKVFYGDSDVIKQVIGNSVDLLIPNFKDIVLLSTDQLIDSLFAVNNILSVITPEDMTTFKDSLAFLSDQNNVGDSVQAKVLYITQFKNIFLTVRDILVNRVGQSSLNGLDSLFKFTYFILAMNMQECSSNLTVQSILDVAKALDTEITGDNAETLYYKIEELYKPDEAPNIDPSLMEPIDNLVLLSNTIGLNLFVVNNGTSVNDLFNLLNNNYKFYNLAQHSGPNGESASVTLTPEMLLFPKDISHEGVYEYILKYNNKNYKFNMLVCDTSTTYDWQFVNDKITLTANASNPNGVDDMLSFKYVEGGSTNPTLLSQLTFIQPDFIFYVYLEKFGIKCDVNLDNIIYYRDLISYVIDDSKHGYSDNGMLCINVPILGSFYPVSFKYNVIDDESQLIKVTHSTPTIIIDYTKEDLNQLANNEYDKNLWEEVLLQLNSNMMAGTYNFEIGSNTLSYSLIQIMNDCTKLTINQNLDKYTINLPLNEGNTVPYDIYVQKWSIGDLIQNMSLIDVNLASEEEGKVQYFKVNDPAPILENNAIFSVANYPEEIRISNLYDFKFTYSKFGIDIFEGSTIDVSTAKQTKTYSIMLLKDGVYQYQKDIQYYVYDTNETILTGFTMTLPDPAFYNIAFVYDDMEDLIQFVYRLSNFISECNPEPNFINGTQSDIDRFKEYPHEFLGVMQYNFSESAAPYYVTNKLKHRIDVPFELVLSEKKLNKEETRFSGGVTSFKSVNVDTTIRDFIISDQLYGIKVHYFVRAIDDRYSHEPVFYYTTSGFKASINDFNLEFGYRTDNKKPYTITDNIYQTFGDIIQEPNQTIYIKLYDRNTRHTFFTDMPISVLNSGSIGGDEVNVNSDTLNKSKVGFIPNFIETKKMDEIQYSIGLTEGELSNGPKTLLNGALSYNALHEANSILHSADSFYITFTKPDEQYKYYYNNNITIIEQTKKGISTKYVILDGPEYQLIITQNNDQSYTVDYYPSNDIYRVDGMSVNHGLLDMRRILLQQSLCEVLLGATEESSSFEASDNSYNGGIVYTTEYHQGGSTGIPMDYKLFLKEDGVDINLEYEQNPTYFTVKLTKLNQPLHEMIDLIPTSFAVKLNAENEQHFFSLPKFIKVSEIGSAYSYRICKECNGMIITHHVGDNSIKTNHFFEGASQEGLLNNISQNIFESDLLTANITYPNGNIIKIGKQPNLLVRREHIDGSDYNSWYIKGVERDLYIYGKYENYQYRFIDSGNQKDINDTFLDATYLNRIFANFNNITWDGEKQKHVGQLQQSELINGEKGFAFTITATQDNVTITIAITKPNEIDGEADVTENITVELTWLNNHARTEDVTNKVIPLDPNNPGGDPNPDFVKGDRISDSELGNIYHVERFDEKNSISVNTILGKTESSQQKDFYKNLDEPDLLKNIFGVIQSADFLTVHIVEGEYIQEFILQPNALSYKVNMKGNEDNQWVLFNNYEDYLLTQNIDGNTYSMEPHDITPFEYLDGLSTLSSIFSANYDQNYHGVVTGFGQGMTKPTYDSTLSLSINEIVATLTEQGTQSEPIYVTISKLNELNEIIVPSGVLFRDENAGSGGNPDAGMGEIISNSELGNIYSVENIAEKNALIVNTSDGILESKKQNVFYEDPNQQDIIKNIYSVIQSADFLTVNISQDNYFQEVVLQPNIVYYNAIVDGQNDSQWMLINNIEDYVFTSNIDGYTYCKFEHNATPFDQFDALAKLSKILLVEYKKEGQDYTGVVTGFSPNPKAQPYDCKLTLSKDEIVAVLNERNTQDAPYTVRISLLNTFREVIVPNVPFLDANAGNNDPQGEAFTPSSTGDQVYVTNEQSGLSFNVKHGQESVKPRNFFDVKAPTIDINEVQSILFNADFIQLSVKNLATNKVIETYNVEPNVYAIHDYASSMVTTVVKGSEFDYNIIYYKENDIYECAESYNKINFIEDALDNAYVRQIFEKLSALKFDETLSTYTGEIELLDEYNKLATYAVILELNPEFIKVTINNSTDVNMEYTIDNLNVYVPQTLPTFIETQSEQGPCDHVCDKNDYKQIKAPTEFSQGILAARCKNCNELDKILFGFDNMKLVDTYTTDPDNGYMLVDKYAYTLPNGTIAYYYKDRPSDKVKNPTPNDMDVITPIIAGTDKYPRIEMQFNKEHTYVEFSQKDTKELTNYDFPINPAFDVTSDIPKRVQSYIDLFLNQSLESFRMTLETDGYVYEFTYMNNAIKTIIMQNENVLQVSYEMYDGKQMHMVTNGSYHTSTPPEDKTGRFLLDYCLNQSSFATTLDSIRNEKKFDLSGTLNDGAKFDFSETSENEFVFSYEIINSSSGQGQETTTKQPVKITIDSINNAYFDVTTAALVEKTVAP